MSFMSMSDEAVAVELGRRIEQLRLERNLTQQELADAVGLSRVTYGKLESGEAKLVNVIAVLRVLDQLPLLEKSFPNEVFSPMELLKLQGKKRQRARGSRGAASKASSENEELDW